MIVDIDVSKCKYYKEYSDPNEDCDEYNDVCECSITESAFCFDKCNSNCYYRNWKLKKKECDEWKSKYYNSTTEVKADLIKQIDELKAENKKYKELANSFENDFFNALSDKESKYVKQLKAENKEFKETISDKEKWLSEIEIKNSEYWKEKYADLHIRYGNRIEELRKALQEIKDYCNKYPQNSIGFKKQILQKCEVIDEM